MKSIITIIMLMCSAFSFAQGVINPESFKIEVNYMNPRKFPSKSLDYGYEVELRNDSAIIYLPYIGEVYMPSTDNDGLHFSEKYKNLSVRHNKKGTATIISFSLKHGTVNYEFHVTAFKGGNADIDVIPSNAQSCSYNGDWENVESNVRTIAITTPPDSLKLNTAFYKKYISVRGLPICSSQNVPDSVFEVAYKTFEALTRMLPDEVMKSMINHGARVTIMGKDEQTCDVPEHRHLKNDPNTDWNKRARGLGGTLWLPMSSCAEENLMAYPCDRYWREDINIHEFAHTIHNVGISPCYTSFNDELKASLEKAKSEGRWDNTYAQGNIEEYFAEGVQDWFNVNTEVDKQNGDGIHNRVNTREELKNYDPTLYNILSRFFPDTNEHISRHKYQNRYIDENMK